MSPIMDLIFQDLRNAWRQLQARPLLSMAALTLLALGLGACATAFSLVNAVYYKPLGFAEPERLLQVFERSPSRFCPDCAVRVSLPVLQALQREGSGIGRFEAFVEDRLAVEARPNAEALAGTLMTPGLFRSLGVQPALGAGFVDDSGRVDGVPGVLLGSGLAERRFGSAAAALGQPLRVGGIEHRVVGVMPDGFRFPEFSELWAPLPLHRTEGGIEQRDLAVVARPAEGLGPDAFAEALHGIGRRLAPEQGEAAQDWTLGVRPLRDYFSEGAGQFFSVLLGAVCLVLVVTCANLSGLVIARGAERRAELAVRGALGAGRLRLLRQLMAEHALLGLLGGLGALVLAQFGVRLIRLALPPEIPYFLDFSLDLRVLSFTLGMGVLSSLLFGLLPALRTSRADLRGALASGGRDGMAAGSARVRRSLVVVEIFLTVLMLGAALAMMLAVVNQTLRGRNYPIEALQQTGLGLPGPEYASTETRNDLLARLQAGLAQQGIQTAISSWQWLSPEADPPGPGLSPLRGAYLIAPDYFTALGLPLRAGRALGPADLDSGQHVVVLGEALASALWPGESAIGRSIELTLEGESPARHEVVGVVADTRQEGYGRRPPRELYLPMREPDRSLSLQVRGRPGQALEPALREVVAGVDPDLTLEPLRPAAAGDTGRWQPRFFSIVLGSFAGMTLLASLAGLYGLIAGAVALRQREFGLRLALGARARQLSGRMLGEGLRLGLLGGLPGLALAALLWSWLGGLFGGQSGSMLPLLALALVFALVVLLACWLPARRVARIDPMSALRGD